MEINVILMVCAITACLFSLVSLILGLLALTRVMAMEKATHSVQFMPVESWASSEEEIKEYNEELSDQFQPVEL